MIIISFLLLIGPGLLVWILCDRGETETASGMARTIMIVILDCFILLIFSYLTLFILYDRTLISFSPTYMPEAERNIYSVTFVWKYGLMAGVYAVILAIIKIVIRRIVENRKGHKTAEMSEAVKTAPETAQTGESDE